MKDDIVNINEIIHKAFDSISVESTKNASKIVEAWRNVLSKIKAINTVDNPNVGQNLIDHSRVVDLKNGILLIEVDHPGWISILQFHKKFILKGLQMNVADVKINSLAFRVKGSTVGISASDNQKAATEEIEKRIETEENNLKKINFSSPTETKNYKTDELAPELAQIFKDLKKSMLTNSKK